MISPNLPGSITRFPYYQDYLGPPCTDRSRLSQTTI